MAHLSSTGSLGKQPIIQLAAKLLLVALAYFSYGRLGLAMPSVGSHVTLIWLPSGIAVAAIMRWGYVCWPGVFLGAFATNFSVDSTPVLDSSIALGNTLAPLLTAWLLRQLKFHPTLDRSDDILLLIGITAISMVVSASIGVSSLVIFQMMNLPNTGMAWLAWWAGDFVGVLLIAPLLLNISRDALKTLRVRGFEFLAWCFITLATCWTVFIFNHNNQSYSLPVVFLIWPFVVWSAMRFNLLGSSIGVLIPSLMGIMATARGVGPFDSESSQQGMFLLWLYIITLKLTELMVSALQAGRKQAETALQKSELQLRTIIDAEPECVKLLAKDGTVLQMNPAGLEMLGADAPEQIVGKKALGLVVSRHRNAFGELMQRVFLGESGHLEFEAVGLKGAHCWLETYAVPMRDANGKITALLGVTRDITVRKSHEEKIERVRQLYAALSQCNQAIVRCTSEAELLPHICRDAVEFGGMKMAWIGMLDESTGLVQPVASYGDHTDYLNGIQISMDASQPSGRGPGGMCMREDKPFWCQDFQHDPATAPWHERGKRAGWKASAGLPLHRNGKVVGAFFLYSSEVNAFDEDIQQLLIEMASDIDFALDNYAREHERGIVEQQLRALTAHLQIVREQEKTSIAREIHDELGGTMTALKIEIHKLKSELPPDNKHPKAAQQIDSMSLLINNAAGITRRIISDLRPTILDDLGLLAAIEWEAEKFHQRTGIDYLVNCIGDKGGLAKTHSIALFRILQESLTNVTRHSGATRVEIEYHHSDSEVMLSICDNGRGLPQQQNAHSISYGILGMRERVEQLGGTIRFESPPKGGLCVMVRLPLSGDTEELYDSHSDC